MERNYWQKNWFIKLLRLYGEILIKIYQKRCSYKINCIIALSFLEQDKMFVFNFADNKIVLTIRIKDIELHYSAIIQVDSGLII